MREIKDLNELKTIELDIMKKVHTFCRDNNFYYCLSHGSLIGAIRHNGFIPWDDDIDIWMLRKDYIDFCKLFEQVGSSMGLKLVNFQTDTYFGRPMSKIIDTRTILTEPEYSGDDPIGVFVDIWPLDGLPDDDELRHKHHTECKKQKDILALNICKFRRIGGKRNKIKALFIKMTSKKKQVEKVDRLLQKYSFTEGKYVGSYTDPYMPIMERQWFSDRELVKFEDTELFVPVGYDSILRTIYGNYLKLPPAEKQIPHHVINTYWK